MLTLTKLATTDLISSATPIGQSERSDSSGRHGEKTRGKVRTDNRSVRPLEDTVCICLTSLIYRK